MIRTSSRFTLRKLPSGETSAMPIGASSKAFAKRASASSSARFASFSSVMSVQVTM